MGPVRRLDAVRRALRRTSTPNPPAHRAAAAAEATAPTAPTMAACGVFPTEDPEVAFEHLRREGICVLSGVLSAEELVPLRERLLEVSARPEHCREDWEGEWRAEQGEAAHPGGHVPAFIRHDQRWGAVAMRPPVRSIVERCFADDWKIIYTTGVVNHVGYRDVLWHSDGHLSQWGKFVDIMPRLVTLWMLNDWSAENGGTLVVRPSPSLPPSLPTRAWIVGRFPARTFRTPCPRRPGATSSASPPTTMRCM